MLKRHYLSHKASEKLALTNPYPTDSALRRHYQSLQASLLNQSQTLSNPVIEDNIASEQVEIAITPEILLVAPKITDNEPSKPTITKTPVIPEDATLRRHFLTHVQSEVANLLGNRPTDSTLKRHYDSLFSSKVSEYLAG